MPLESIARKDDPISHGGYVIQGSTTVLAGGKQVARVGDQVSCNIHGVQLITSGGSIKVNGKICAIDGSHTTCGAQVIATYPQIKVGE